MQDFMDYGWSQQILYMSYPVLQEKNDFFKMYIDQNRENNDGVI